MYTSSGGGQKGPLQDPRHGKARGEVIAGGAGSDRLGQIGFVLLVLVGAGALLVTAATLLSPDPNASPTMRYLAYGVLAALALLLIYRQIRRRRSRRSLNEVLRRRD